MACIFFLFQLEPYMDEDFIRGAFAAMGETNVLTIKVGLAIVFYQFIWLPFPLLEHLILK